MNEMLKSLKADLLSRRMLPLLILAAVALLGAAGYAVAGGSSAPPPAPSSTVAAAPPVEGPSVSAAPANPHAALAETTSGGSFQHTGHMRNPFAPLPGSESEEASSASTGSTGATSTTTGSNGSSGSTSAGEEPSSSGQSATSGEGSTGTGSTGGEASGAGSTGSLPSASTIYDVSVKLVKLDESGKPTGSPQRFSGVQRLTPLPSRKRPMVAFYGVAANGEAVFVLLTPAILHGPASCLPSPANCEGIALKQGEGEELQYLTSADKVIAYRLKVTKIAKISATASAARAAHRRISKQGSKLIAGMRLSMPDGIHYSQELGVLLGVSRAIAEGRQSSIGAAAKSSTGAAAKGPTGTIGAPAQGSSGAQGLTAQGSTGSPE